ncbi:MAG: immunoglobulin domain-containing protein [Pirellulales bacterium]|nr:immunoglobulin domain-containing protein [Pirellulales bacterium]
MLRLPLLFAAPILFSVAQLAVAQGGESSASGASANVDVTNGIRLVLMDRGQVVYGTLSVSTITVKTEFGSLEIPIDQIVSFTPGLESHPAEQDRINRLIQELGANEEDARNEAERQLMGYGPGIRPVLEQYMDDDDAERKVRINTMIEELDSAADEDFSVFGETPDLKLIPQDSIETQLFTVVGKIAPQAFEMKTEFGTLNISLADIKLAQRELSGVQEMRKSLAVTGMHMADSNWKSSGIRVNRGDQVTIAADGQIVMTPWGNNSTSTPDGSPNYQWYRQNEIPGGALVYRIGGNGKVEKGGSNKVFTADRSGVLEFGVGIAPQFANQGYNYPGQYQVKVRVKTKQ